MKRKSSRYAPPAESPRFSGGGERGPFNYLTVAVLGGVFILGIALGIVFSSSASFSPENIASREAIDRSAPNPELCARYGASAVVSDMRVFMTFNPFNVYISQPRMQPGCVLRRNNWAVLEQRDLVSNTDVRQCRNRMNTFGFTGDIGDTPNIDCVYQNDAAGNMFLNQPGFGAPPPESEQF